LQAKSSTPAEHIKLATKVSTLGQNWFKIISVGSGGLCGSHGTGGLGGTGGTSG
jgi:hypothetical protein